jgi:methyl-accepting chemotaxis protein
VETPGLAALPDPEAAEAERRRQEELIRKIEETVRAETETRAQEMADQTRTRLQALESATRGRLGALDAETQRRLENLRAANRQEMQAVLISLVVLFVILVLLGIVVTHRVAGPIYKMKLLMAKIDGDHLRLDGQLRRGDELRDLFEELSGMLERLRNHQRSEITDLDALLERLRTAKDDDERTSALSALEAFRERMEGALAGKA